MMDYDGYIGDLESDMSLMSDRIAELEAENERLRNPWINIVEGDAGTLPKDYSFVIVSFVNLIGGTSTIDGGYDNGKFYTDEGEEIPGVYAWQPWPDPAPFIE